MDNPGHHAPAAEFAQLRDLDVGVGGVFCAQDETAAVEMQSIDAELPVKDGDDDVSMSRGDGPVNNEPVGYRTKGSA